MNYKNINERIENEYDEDIYNAISDKNLIDIFKKTPSGKQNIYEMEKILKNDENTIDDKINLMLLKFIIPSGTKGVVRGNEFNTIIKKQILNFNLDSNIFYICFEQNCESEETGDKPDWFIRNKISKKLIIGYNQLDLWGGGHQNNRADKYLVDNKHNNSNCKLLCVVCNKTMLTSKKSKKYKHFKIGFENNTLCYPKNLKNIIYTYFNINN